MSAGDLVSGEIMPALGLPFKRFACGQIVNANLDVILEVWSGGSCSSEESDAIEELVVRACNRDHAFDDLVKALQEIATDICDNQYTRIARAALAKAGVK